MFHLLTLALLSGLSHAIRTLPRCPPTGPVLPPPIIDSLSIPRLVSALSSLSTNSSAFNSSTTSFSLQITSRNSTLFDYHHTATVRNPNGTDVVDGDTIYRACSVTKVFNVLTLLLEAPETLDHPIGRYVPELAGVEEYEEVTVRMLASQMGGVPRDGRALDLYTLGGPQLEELGFPSPPEEDIPTCDTTTPCNRSEMFQLLLQNHLTGLPGRRAAYSDQGYELIAFALENITGKAWTDLVTEKVSAPLGLSSSTFDLPDLKRMILPDGQGSLFATINLGNHIPTAGLYSTASDLSSFLRGILTHVLLSPIRTAQWLQPTAFASSLSNSIGMPWEIFRVVGPAAPRVPRPIDVYTKSGSMPGWASYVALIPEYGVGITILAAGDDAYDASAALLDLATAEVLPVMDDMAREQADALYAGRYRSTSTNPVPFPSNSTHSNSSDTAAEGILSLTLDDGPGLKITEWTRGGKSITAAFATYWGHPNETVDARLYPLGAGPGDRWRLGMEMVREKGRWSGESEGSVVLGPACEAWLSVDQFRWATLPVDEFVFEKEEEEERAVDGVEVPGLRMKLVKE